MNSSRIEEVLRANSAALLALPGAVGVAQGMCNSEPCIRIFFADRAAAERANVPRELGGFPVIAEITGRFDARE